MRQIIFVLIVLVGFGLRMVKLGDVPPRWDEGWSVAHAALGLADIVQITAADVHPPLYYMVLGLWQRLFGTNLFGARYLSVLMSVPAIPLAYVVAKKWTVVSGQWSFALIASMFMAWLPLAVYYSGVVRMYAPVPTLILLTIYFLLQISQDGERVRRYTPFVISAVALMLTLYHAAWALAGLGLYIVLVGKRTKSILWAIGLATLAYLPWAIYAIPQLLGRASAEATRNTNQQLPLAYWLEQAIQGLTLSREVGWLGIELMAVLVLLGIAWHWRRRNFGAITSLRSLLLPALMIVFTLFGVAYAARNWALNERMLVAATPALALLLAWAMAQFPPKLAALAGLGLVGIYFGTSTSVVFDKTLEVFDAYDPHQYQARIAPKAQPSDVVVFNVLSPAGFYTLDRKPNDPTWSYALTWDPVIEPREQWQVRLQGLAQQHPRVWVVLYRGLAGQNGPLRGWLDSNFYPASGDWGAEEVFIGLYGAPKPMRNGVGAGTRWGDLELRSSQLATQMRAGEIIPVGLMWRATAHISTGYKIFVHAITPDSRVIAQHDAQPLNDLRPFFTLPVGEDVPDHHGLALPPDYRGMVQVVMGLYDPNTGQRIRLSGGADVLEIGEIRIED